MDLVTKLEQNSVKHSLFREPDYNNEATSVCIEPGILTRKFTSNFRLAFKNDPLKLSGRASVSKTEVTGSIPVRITELTNKNNNHENEVDQIQQKSVVSFYDRMNQLKTKIKTKLWKQ